MGKDRTLMILILSAVFCGGGLLAWWRAAEDRAQASFDLGKALAMNTESLAMKADAVLMIDTANQALAHAQAMYHERMPDQSA